MTDFSWEWWTGFSLLILVFLALDLGVFHRKAHVVGIREALIWSAIWITTALLFNGWLWFHSGQQKALEFFTGYLIEKSLSVDNVFVFAMLFSFFAVPPIYQHKVLFWGILGALVMRAAMIWAGSALIQQFAWVIYIFGAFLILTGVKMLFHKGEELHPHDNPAVRLFKRFVPCTNDYHEDKFFVRIDGRLLATPLMVVLVCVEFTDLIFAVDSIPAIFAVTRDPFIVFTSNVFAILGLRALYFALAGVMHLFRFLKTGLGLVLVFVGVKMILAHTAWKIDTMMSLLVVATILTVSVIASLVWREQANEEKKESEQPSVL